MCAECGISGALVLLHEHHKNWTTCDDCNRREKGTEATCKDHIEWLCVSHHHMKHGAVKKKLGLSFDWRQRQMEMQQLQHLGSI